jgi:porphobilinogen synthase
MGTVGFPIVRPRRLRQNPLIREMVRQTVLDPADFILPLFVRAGSGIRHEISSMPGNFQLSVDCLVEEVGAAKDLGMLEDGIVQQALRALRKAYKNDVVLITDECFCEYTDHGHCGPMCEVNGRLDVDNDATLPLLAQQCISHAQAGADMVAPSGMMDGMVQAIRIGLDRAGLTHIPIMSYAAKYASGFYGPFREAAESPRQLSDGSRQ